MQLIKLGTIVTDTVSGLKGILTHVIIDMDHKLSYIFQPKKLNPTTGLPVEKIYVSKSQLKGYEEIEVDLPLHVLGTKAEDMGTGFKGIILELIQHATGCLHVNIRPSGINANNSVNEAVDFDINRVKGEAIEIKSEAQIAEVRKKKPSPDYYPKKRL